MKIRSSHPLYWLSGLACAIGLLAFGYQRLPMAQSQEAPLKEANSPVKTKYFGSTHCEDCHTRGTRLAEPICTCKEYPIWKKDDKHSLALELLKGERAKQMGKALNIENVLIDPKCLNCHGVPGTVANFDSSFFGPDKLSLEEAKIREGITCTVCHGASGKWVAPHSAISGDDQRKEWLALSRQEKETKFGMTDLWDPKKRAELCLSCHVGNLAQKKYVTHAMYAAGHPPLPGVELTTFSDQMPKHWEYLADKSIRIPGMVQKLLNYDPKDAALEKTRLVLTSGMAAFRDSMQLLAIQAEEVKGTGDKEKAWPELAQFDCYACHHELKTPAWRQNRLPKGKPGRPQMREWPTALVKASLLFLGDKPSELAEHLKPLRQEFDNTPFGNPEKVAAVADKVAAWADERLKALNAKKKKKDKADPDQFERPLDRAGALTILRSLATLPADETPDYDSARQIAWAIDIIYHELFTADHPAAKHEKIEKQLVDLRKHLKLKLPSGKAQSIVDQLGESMKTLGEYNPDDFKTALAELLKLLPEQA